MYYSGYNPAIHDIYLYGPGNVGLPIGLNPTSLIYGASADFASVQPRYRSFSVTGPVPIPPGAGVTSLPNYYNIGSPLSIVAGEKTLLGCIHYLANKPSDSVSAVGTVAKYTGTTTAYPYLSIDLWNNTLTGFCSYGPLTGIYNCVPLDRLGGPTAYSPLKYFSGSPEIPGFGTGATFYQILADDVGFMDLIGSGPTFSQPIIKKISLSTLCQELIEQGMTADYTLQTDSSFQVRIPTINTYLWDGNDKVIPLDSITYNYGIDAIPPTSYYASSPNECFAEFHEIDGKSYSIWVGDSSSPLIYIKNNFLYFIAEAQAVSDYIVSGVMYRRAVMPLYMSETLPLYDYVGPLIDKNHYSTPLHQGLTLATQSDFNTLQATLNNFNTSVNNLYDKWTT